MLFLIVALIVLGIFSAILGWLSHNKKGENSVILADDSCATCLGDNPKCEQVCMMEAATRDIEYFDDEELDRCVVEQWIKSPQENFYDEVAPILRSCIEGMRPTLEKMSILRPFSFVLIDEDHETVQDLVIIDNEETMVIDGNLLEGLEEELDDFLKKLLSD